MEGNENSSPVALIYDDDLIPFASAFPEDLIGTGGLWDVFYDSPINENVFTSSCV